MKKKLVSALLIAAMASSLVACGGKDDTKDTTAASKETESQAADDSAIQNLISKTNGEVSLRLWCSETEAWQGVMATVVDNFKAQYPDVTFDITIESESEANAKDDILADPEAAADVFVFASDQLAELVNAGAIQSLDTTYTYNPAEAYSENALEAASQDGKLYAYPLTASNGYFLYYDSSVFSEEDVASWESLVAAAEKNNVTVGMEMANAWYTYGFMAGAGLTCTLAEDGKTNTCDWNTDTGYAVAEAVQNLCSSDAFVNLAEDAAGPEQAANGNLKAFVNGTWNAEAVKAAYGDGYAACKLPTLNVNGQDIQMGSFAGYKFVGVNAYTKNDNFEKAWAMVLAEYISSEASQELIGEATAEGMANTVAASKQTSPELAAISEQSAYANLQVIGDNYWSPAATLFSTLYAGTDDVKKAVDEAVAGITAEVATE